MIGMTLATAKKLYFSHDGSLFYMSRDGTDRAYLRAKVGRTTEAKWLRELTARKLRALRQAGNWRTIHFLNHYSDYRRLSKVFDVKPLGVFWERCVFLEELLEYAMNCDRRASPAMIERAISHVMLEAAGLLRRARSEKSRLRVEKLLDKARVAAGK